MLPLTGIRVVELASVLAGPEVGRFLAELGATVVKYEAPGGDVTRSWRLSTEDRTSSISAYFAAVNAGKSYQSLNLKSEAGLSHLKELLADADILLTNFKSEDEAIFGLTSESLKREFPSLIWGKISGFSSNPSRPAFDVVLQAETGWMSMTGEPNGNPVKLPVALIDIIAAHQLKEAIVLGLYERLKTGLGSHWKVSLEDASLSALANQATNYWMNESVATAMGTAHPNIAPYGDLLPTSDQRWAIPAIGSQSQFVAFCEIIGAPEIAIDLRFRSNIDRVTNRSALIQTLRTFTQKMESAHLSNACVEKRVPLGIIKDLGEVLSTQTAENVSVSENMDSRDTKRVKSFVATRID